MKMCEVDPLKRITAKDSLRHKFFTDVQDHEMVIENIEDVGDRFQEYNK